jgi:hypothetical protein
MRTSALRALWSVVVGALAALVLIAPTAWAHSELASSDPADGAALAAPPQAITFTFNEELLEQGNAITLTALATGERLELGDVAVAGDTVSVDWPASSPAGEFRAAYRVVSADGHPIDGAVTFTVDEAVGQSSPAPAQPSAPPASASPIAEPVQPDPAAAEDESSAVWALAVGAVALAAVATALVVARRGR